MNSYELANVKRDLSDVLSDVIACQPRLISLFQTKSAAKQRKHEWLEDQIVGRSLTAVSVNASTNTVTASVADVAKLKVGTLLTIKDDTVLLRVTTVGTTTFVYEVAAAHGSATVDPADSSTLFIVSTPMAEATGNGDGEQNYRQSGTGYNHIQTFRKEIVLSQVALSTTVYGNIDNQINKNTRDALNIMARDMNRQSLFGMRVEGTSSIKGEAGGLYEFGTLAGALTVNAAGVVFDSYIVNDAIQAIMDEGGEPSAVLCGTGQARVLSNEFKKSLQILRQDEARGAYVARIVNELSGKLVQIVVEPDMPDTEAFVLDTAGLGLCPLDGDALRDEDATEKGFHGIKRVAFGSYTFEFKNAAQRICRIKGLMGSAAAIASIKAQADS